MITKETNVKTKQEEQKIQVSNTACFQVILYNILTWHAIRFVEHDAIRAFQDSLFACLIFHAKGVCLCACAVSTRARVTYQSQDRAPLLLKLYRACNNHLLFGYTHS